MKEKVKVTLRTRIESTNLPEEKEEEREKCTCGRDTEDSEEWTETIHICPFQEEINNYSEPYCNCCSACMYKCAMDI